MKLVSGTQDPLPVPVALDDEVAADAVEALELVVVDDAVAPPVFPPDVPPFEHAAIAGTREAKASACDRRSDMGGHASRATFAPLHAEVRRVVRWMASF